MADTSATVGRFSSQILAQFGIQQTVNAAGNTNITQAKYSNGKTTFPTKSTPSTQGVVGSYGPATYNSTRSYFISRGASAMYADSMTALAVDISNILGISTQAFLEQSDKYGKFSLSNDAYTMFNQLRNPGHQVGTVTTVVNSGSLQARAIRG